MSESKEPERGLMFKEVSVSLRLAEFGFESRCDWPISQRRVPASFKVDVRTRVDMGDGWRGMEFATVQTFNEDSFDSHFERLVAHAVRDIKDMIGRARRGEPLCKCKEQGRTHPSDLCR